MKASYVLLLFFLTRQNLLVAGGDREMKYSDAAGPCIIRRTRLPRLDPVKVMFISFAF